MFGDVVMASIDKSAAEARERYSHTSRRLVHALVCILEQPIGFAIPALALVVFLSAPQMPDMFAGLAADAIPGRAWFNNLHPLTFGLASAFLGFAAWYWSRAALMAREQIDDVERRIKAGRRGADARSDPPDWAREWAPRIALGLAALIALTPLYMTISVPGRTLYDAPLLASASGVVLVFIAFLITRYRLALGLTGGLRAHPLMWRLRTTAILGAAPFGWLMALFLLALCGGAAWLLGTHPELIEKTLDTPSAGLLALAFAIAPLIFVLAVIRDLVELALFALTLPLRLFSKLPYLDEFADVLGLGVLLSVLFTPAWQALYRWTPPDYYIVRTTQTALNEEGPHCGWDDARGRKAAAQVATPVNGSLQRPNISEALAAYKQARLRAGDAPDHPMPAIIIAAEGGASRSAIWLLSSMRMLDQKTNGDFGRHVFAISGVSGGAFGAVTYLQALRAHGEEKGGLDWTKPKVAAGLTSLAEADLLSATLSTYFLNDTFGRMLGHFWPYPDRGQALEHAFEREWKAGFSLSDMQALQGIIALQQKTDAPGEFPHLFLNGTDAKTGRRVITSTVRFDRRDDLFAASDDLLAILGRDVPASVAVSNSARFPYLNPAGRYFDKCQGQRQILDGGYFENYGARTASELAYKIDQLAQSGDPLLKGLVPIVVVISSDADAYRDPNEARKANGLTLWRASIACRAGRALRDNGPPTGTNTPSAQHHEVPDLPALPEIPQQADAVSFEGATPILGLYAAHGAHGQDALHILRRQLCPSPGSNGPARMIHIALPKPVGPNEAAPMNWVLNPAARNYLLGNTGVFDTPFNVRQAAPAGTHTDGSKDPSGCARCASFISASFIALNKAARP